MELSFADLGQMLRTRTRTVPSFLGVYSAVEEIGSRYDHEAIAFVIDKAFAGELSATDTPS
jgi:hypothetical protein